MECAVFTMLPMSSAECVLERTINQSPKLATIKTLSEQKWITRLVHSGAYLHDNPKILILNDSSQRIEGFGSKRGLRLHRLMWKRL